MFKLTENNTNVRTEIGAGITTFMTMAYIIFVQPHILSAAGMDSGSVMMATCIAAAIGSLMMGFLANYPIGVAPGMGENFFFAYTLVLGMGIPWEKALGIVFISGVLFILLTFFKIRAMVVNAVPDSLKHAIPVGIGLFISLIGMYNAGIVVSNPSAILRLGDFTQPKVLLSIFGIIFTAVLLARGVRGAILIGIVVNICIAVAAGFLTYGGVVQMPPSIAPTFFKMDVLGALELKYVVAILVFLYMALFDTVGTLIGVTSQAGIMKDGKIPRVSRALMADAVATTAGAALGTSTTLAYIESASGVKVGGRTGLTAVVVGLLFIAAIFFYPLVKMVSAGTQLPNGLTVNPVTSPAMILVGAMMMSAIKNIDWDDYFDAIPAFLVIVAIPFSSSIADGIAVGFISYPVIKLFGGRAREVGAFVYVLAVLFILRYIFI